MMDVTVENFETEVIAASMNTPVLVDFWAPWCGPCKQLQPAIEKVVKAAKGAVKLVKINIDQNQMLAQQLRIQSIPAVYAFFQGQPVDGFVGAIPEAQIRTFLDKHVPSEAEIEAEADLEEAEALAEDGNAEAALAKLQEAVAIDPSNEGARFDYVKLLLQEGRVSDARRAYEPVAGKAMVDQRIAALGAWLDACEAMATARPMAELDAAIAANKRDFEARHDRARQLFALQEHTAAMDELLEILMRDKAWSDGRARKTYVAILELMTKPAPKPAAVAETKGAVEIAGKTAAVASDPLLDQYRRKLSMVLF
jgi:putative thioredoxin